MQSIFFGLSNLRFADNRTFWLSCSLEVPIKDTWNSHQRSMNKAIGFTSVFLPNKTKAGQPTASVYAHQQLHQSGCCTCTHRNPKTDKQWKCQKNGKILAKEWNQAGETERDFRGSLICLDILLFLCSKTLNADKFEQNKDTLNKSENYF